MTEKQLGKISKVSFGYGGYQDAMFGLSVTLDFKGSGCFDFKGGWSLDIEHTEYCKWTEEDRDKQFAETMRYVNQLLKDAKKRTVDQLQGVPIEAELEGLTLKSWRILTEVI